MLPQRAPGTRNTGRLTPRISALVLAKLPSQHKLARPFPFRARRLRAYVAAATRCSVSTIRYSQLSGASTPLIWTNCMMVLTSLLPSPTHQVALSATSEDSPQRAESISISSLSSLRSNLPDHCCGPRTRPADAGGRYRPVDADVLAWSHERRQLCRIFQWPQLGATPHQIYFPRLFHARTIHRNFRDTHGIDGTSVVRSGDEDFVLPLHLCAVCGVSPAVAPGS
ncbi:hypothetical protein C8Q76DRAFT_485164 [Earliella scabrosa]|nr:hypothetical protein C8Q76DRAFT_485164 [Earliella scabrosa]